MTPSAGIEPGTHWWKASALTTAPTLLPQVHASPSRKSLFTQVLVFGNIAKQFISTELTDEKTTIFWLASVIHIEYISVKIDTQLKVVILYPNSEVVVQESFRDKSTKNPSLHICKFLSANKHLVNETLPYPVGKIKQLKHLFPLDELQLVLLVLTST